MPFQGTTIASAPQTGTGIWLVPSTNLAATPAQVDTRPVEYLSVAWSPNASLPPSSYQPDVMFYAAGASGSIHIYALNLGSSTPPSPVQISNLTLSSFASICGYQQFQTNVLDPTTTFILLHTATTCDSAGDQFQVVHYADSATTAPVATSVTSSSFVPLIQANGMLAGLVMLNSSGDVDLYASDAFSAPKVLQSGVGKMTYLGGASDSYMFANGSAVFLALDTSSGTGVYRVDAAGTISGNLYTVQGVAGLGTADNTNLYVIDQGTNLTFVQLPFTGDSALTLYQTAATGAEYTFLGSTGSKVVFQALTDGISATFATVPVGSISTTATTIGSVGPIYSGANLWSPSAGDFADSLLFINVLDESTLSYSSEILSPSGAIEQPMTAGSYFWGIQGENPYGAAATAGVPLQAVGMTGAAGGTLQAVGFSGGTLTGNTSFTTTGGGAYVLPAAILQFYPASSLVGDGQLNFGGGVINGFALNASTLFATPVTVANTNIWAMF